MSSMEELLEYGVLPDAMHNCRLYILLSHAKLCRRPIRRPIAG